MTIKTPSAEFEFLMSKLVSIGKLLVVKDDHSIIEAAFMIGCLHSICDQNARDFSKYIPECKADLH